MSKTVRTYGMTLSSIYHDVITSDGDMEGLIIGHVKKKIDNIIEDDVEKQLINICIDIVDFVVTGSNYSFYNPKGQLNGSYIKEILDKYNEYKLLGWFKSRRGLPLRPTMLDYILHENIVYYCKNTLNEESYDPYYMIFSTDSEDLILRFEYKLLEQKGQGFSDVPLNIINLMSSSKREYNEFTDLSSNEIPFENDDSLQKMYKYVNELNLMEFPPKSVSLIESILDSALDDMRALSKSIIKSEEELMKLKAKSKASK